MCAFCNAHPLLRLGGDDVTPAASPEPAFALVDIDQDEPSALNDDIADNTSTTAVLPIGGVVSTSIQSSGDVDYFRIVLEAGRTYTFHMEGLGLQDSYLEMRDANGALLKENDDGGIGINAFLVYRAEASGTYYVAARAWGAGDTGTYRLTSAEIPRGSTSPTPIAETPTRPAFSWDEAAIQLSRDGHSWASSFGQSAVVTYGFRSTAPSTMPTDLEGNGTFARFNAQQIQAAEQALQSWAQVANITFVRVGSGTTGEGAYSNNAAILFSSYTTTAETNTSGFAYLPNSANQSASSAQGDVWINVGVTSNTDPLANPNGMRTLVHEIGHAIGLRHPGDYDGGTPTYAADATYAQDSVQYTSMSYFQASSTGGAMTAWSQMPYIHDIAAAQRLYGANMNTRTGDTVYGFGNNTGNVLFGPSTSNSMYFTIWDGGGHDTLNLSGYVTPSLIDLRPEGFSSAGPVVQAPGTIAQWNIAIARGVIIEDAIGGAGNDLFAGNDAANRLIGNGGNDLIMGGPGADWMEGGAGDDRFDIHDGHFEPGEIIDGGAGFDTIRTLGLNVDYRVGTISSIERIQFIQIPAPPTNYPTLNAMIDASQIGAGFASNLVVSGSAAQDSVQIFVAAGATVNTSGWTFDYPSWSFADYLVYVGDSGNESFIGFPGLDVFFGSPGNDTFDGRDAFDFAAYIFSPFAVTADLAVSGPQFIGGNQGADTFLNLEGLAGSQLNDVLYGDHQDNILMGMYGNDVLYGRAGNDDIRGYEGSDIIEGGMGADTLWGAAEVFAGPDGADTFRYRNAAEGGDTIMDFQSGIDRIEVSGAGFGGGLVAGGSVALTANAAPVATGGAGQFLYNTSTGALSWDADGTGAGAAVLLASLRNAPTLTTASFIVSGISGASLLGGDQGEPMEAFGGGKVIDLLETSHPETMADSFDFEAVALVAAKSGDMLETLPPDLFGGIGDSFGVEADAMLPDVFVFDARFGDDGMLTLLGQDVMAA